MGKWKKNTSRAFSLHLCSGFSPYTYVPASPVRSKFILNFWKNAGKNEEKKRMFLKISFVFQENVTFSKYIFLRVGGTAPINFACMKALRSIPSNKGKKRGGWGEEKISFKIPGFVLGGGKG